MKRLHRNLREQRSVGLRTIYALCLLGATYNHWTTIYQHGFHWNYGGFPKASITFWTVLTFLDPAAVVLLLARPNTGVAVTMAIIITDVIHNLWMQAQNFPPLLQGIAASPQVVEQLVFMTFVVITAPFAWRSRRQAAVLM